MNKKGKETDFQNILLKWYERENRLLPWRETKDPYKIWLSEIILQQTRVDQGMPYYIKFVENYPTVEALAKAPDDEVLRLWQGLGYYSRARNLHFTAKYIAQELNGAFPKTAKELEKLKGVGKYTAAAIASFAYNEKVAVCDGNVQRVLARVFGLYDDISTGRGVKKFQEKAQELISEEEPATYNQAIMEFGALYCTPKNMDCDNCQMKYLCHAYEKEAQFELPVKSKKIKQRQRYFNYYVLQYQDRFWLKRRGPKDIWEGLYEFYNMEKEEITEPSDLDVIDGGVLISVSPTYKHILSHQIIWARFLHYKLEKLPADFSSEEFYTKEQMEELPKPILLVNYLNRLKF